MAGVLGASLITERSPTVTKKISIGGKKFAIYNNPFVIPGKEPSQVVVVNTVIFKCPLFELESQPCQSWIALTTDFAPTAWVCPACSGVFALDIPDRINESEPPDLVATLSPRYELVLYCYSVWSVIQYRERLMVSLMRRTNGVKLMVAEQIEPEALAACRRDNTLQRKAPLKLVLGVNMQGRTPLIGEKWP